MLLVQAPRRVDILTDDATRRVQTAGALQRVSFASPKKAAKPLGLRFRWRRIAPFSGKTTTGDGPSYISVRITSASNFA